MSKKLVAASPIVMALIKEGLSICHTLLSHRQSALQIELERQSMHRQADQAILEEKNRHEREMLKIRQLGEQFNIVIQKNVGDCRNTMKMYELAHNNAARLLEIISDPDMPHEIRMDLLKKYHYFQQESFKLSSRHHELAGQTLTFFEKSCEGLENTQRNHIEFF